MDAMGQHGNGGSLDERSPDEYYQLLFLYLVKDQFDEATQLLRFHGSFAQGGGAGGHHQTGEVVGRLIAVLESMPRFQKGVAERNERHRGAAGSGEEEKGRAAAVLEAEGETPEVFRVRWDAWRETVEEVKDDAKGHAALLEVARFIGGDVQVIQGRCSSWFDLLASLLQYVHPTLPREDAYRTLQECLEHGKRNDPDYDAIKPMLVRRERKRERERGEKEERDKGERDERDRGETEERRRREIEERQRRGQRRDRGEDRGETEEKQRRGQRRLSRVCVCVCVCVRRNRGG
jgi:hypothetical protein